MALSVCPAAQVEAPVERVWRLLNDPAMYSTWADAVVQSIEPAGKAHPGQVVRLWSKALGLKWNVTMRNIAVDEHNHRISLETHLPFGLVLHNTITCTATNAHVCYVRYG